MSDLVYIARCPNGLTKIGYSANVMQRVTGLRRNGAPHLTVLRVFAGNRDMESRLHRYFKAYRIDGEWYLFCAKMLSVQKAELGPGYYRPHAYRRAA